MSQDSSAQRPQALRRWLVLAAIVISAAAVFALDRLPRSPIAGPPASASSVPPNPVRTKPPDPTVDPDSVAACAVDDLAFSAGAWSGATGSMAGGASVINVSSDRCRVAGKPGLELRARRGVAIATGSPPADGERLVLAPGGVTSVITVWRNWCADRPAPPPSLHLELFGIDGALDATVTDWENAGGEGGSVPRCDLASAPSTIDAPLPFAAPEPA